LITAASCAAAAASAHGGGDLLQTASSIEHWLLARGVPPCAAACQRGQYCCCRDAPRLPLRQIVDETVARRCMIGLP
jgi:hypothetical protein